MKTDYYDKSFRVHTLFTLPYIESFYDEEDSHYILNEIIKEFSDFAVYDSKNELLSLDTVIAIANNYALFHASITHGDAKNLYINLPLAVFRYIMLEDLSWSFYDTIRRKPGYVVEGMFWTNGMVYQVREDKEKDFEVYQICVYIDKQTVRKYNYPIL
jgi:hypothetical protein